MSADRRMENGNTPDRTTPRDTPNSPIDTPTRVQERRILYGVEEVPPPHLCFAFALQQVILCLGSALSIPFILTKLLCADGDVNVTAQLLCISMFMCGLATVLQTTTGVRLGIIQGGSHTFIGPIAAMMALEAWKCPSIEHGGVNATSSPMNTTVSPVDDPWKVRIREIQGNLMLASLVQVLLGCTGLVGFFLRFIGPLTIAPTIALIGLSLTEVAAGFNEIHWGISIFTIFLVMLFSTYFRKFEIPIPSYNRQRNCHIARLPLFQLIPVLLSVLIAWLLCHILTITDAISNDPNHINYKTRTDSKQDIISSMPWFYFPLPLHFGTPTISVAGFVGMLGATLSSIVESVGDYFLAARISNAKPPPSHALNRGIATEGFASVISGLVGAGHATTSYSGNIGEIGITKVASRVVFQLSGVIMIICGLIGKFGAVLSIIPDPIIGGTLTVVFGMVAAAGISTLRFVDLTSSRNAVVLAISFILGLMIPTWIQKHPEAIDTGSVELDEVLKVLLGTAIFVGGIIGFILDNTIPGTEEERGILTWRGANYSQEEGEDQVTVRYELPLVTTLMRRVTCLSYIPISPTFDREITCGCCKEDPEVSPAADNVEMDERL